MITMFMTRWYPCRARSGDPSEGDHQRDEHPQGEAEADEVQATRPAGSDAEGGHQETEKSGQIDDELERVRHRKQFLQTGADGATRPTPDGYLLTSTNHGGNAGATRSQGGWRTVDPENLAEDVADLADGCHAPQRLAHRHQQVGLRLGDGGVEMEQAHRLLLALGVAVDTHHHLAARLDRLELLVGGTLDLLLLEAALDRGHRPTQPVDLGDELTRSPVDLVGEALDEVRPGEGIDGVGDARLVGEHLLAAQRQPRG